MNQKCAFTICAKNYIGLAQTLEKSLRANNPDINFMIIVADDVDGSIIADWPENILIAKNICDIQSEDWRDMTFKYDVVEFCTAIKPFCMSYLLDKGYEIVMYFDPDILVFSPLTSILKALESHTVAVTPHRIDFNNDIAWRGGIYNLGFLALRKTPSAERMLGWWGGRLKKNASVDPMLGIFTDQKWMDMLPVVLDDGDLFVSRHPGWNYAPWNFDERQVVKRDDHYFVKFKKNDNGEEFPLVFLHYSAFKYQEISRGNYSHKSTPMEGREPELFELIRLYGAKIDEGKFQQFLEYPYSFNTYSDGTPIQYAHRRIYKRLVEEGYEFTDPFDASGKLFELFHRNHMLKPAIYNPERITKGKIANMDGKIRVIDIFFASLIRAIGYSRFSLLARFMIRYLHMNNRARFLGGEFRKLEVKTF